MLRRNVGLSEGETRKLGQGEAVLLVQSDLDGAKTVWKQSR